MLQGDRIKVSNRDGRKKTGSKVGMVIHVDKYTFTLQFKNKYGESTYREAFNLTDVKLQDELMFEKKINGEYVQISRYVEDLRRC